MTSTLKQQHAEKVKAEKEAAKKATRNSILKTLRHVFTLGLNKGPVVQALRIDGKVKVTLFHENGKTESRTVDDTTQARMLAESWLKG